MIKVKGVIKMGQAKRRGTREERKNQAVNDGRSKVQKLSSNNILRSIDTNAMCAAIAPALLAAAWKRSKNK